MPSVYTIRKPAHGYMCYIELGASISKAHEERQQTSGMPAQQQRGITCGHYEVQRRNALYYDWRQIPHAIGSSCKLTGKGRN